MGDQKKSKGSRRPFSAFRSSSDSNRPPGGLASIQSGSDSRQGQSSGGQGPQQAASPPTISLRSRLFNKLGRRSPSPSPPPEFVPPNINITSDHPPVTSTPQSLAVSPSVFPRPHSSYSQTSTLQTHGSSFRDPPLLTAGGNVIAVSSGDHEPPSSSDDQGSPLASASAPIIQVSYSLSEPIANNNPVPPSTYAPHIPTPTQAHPLVPPKLASAIEPPSHSVWTKALEIAKQKLSDNNLPPLDLTNLTSQSAEESIEAVVKALNTLQEDDKKKRWSYTWRGKKVIIVERVGKILRSIETYSKAVGTAIQSSPQCTV